jgi:hypothetical protein
VAILAAGPTPVKRVGDWTRNGTRPGIRGIEGREETQQVRPGAAALVGRARGEGPSAGG